MDDKEMTYYRFGPSNNLKILGISIDTYPKYTCVLSYCVINSIMRSITHNILTPWMTNVIQDVTKNKDKNIHMFAYEVTYVISIYSWVDWYLYLNFLLSQVDIFLVEICVDLIMAGILTRYYLNKKTENYVIETPRFIKCTTYKSINSETIPLV